MQSSRKKFKTIDAYIAAQPRKVREILKKMRKVIGETAPEASETISYAIPTFRLNGNLVHFAAFSKHIGFYPTSSGIAAFQKELTPHKHSKGSVQFPIDKPIPYAIIKKIVRYRVNEVKSK